MKNRSLKYTDHWRTPKSFYDKLNRLFQFNFDPCPYRHDIDKWDGLQVPWNTRNYVNPPYSQKIKEAFIVKALEESRKGKLCVLLLPVSTSTWVFHNVIIPNADMIGFVRGRIPFQGFSSKGEKVNWPGDPQSKTNHGMHDSMIVVFDKQKKYTHGKRTHYLIRLSAL